MAGVDSDNPAGGLMGQGEWPPERELPSSTGNREVMCWKHGLEAVFEGRTTGVTKCVTGGRDLEACEVWQARYST